MKSTIYIAGPMTGTKDFNRKAFNVMALELESNGYNVLNPATLPDGLTQRQYMSICLPMLMAADNIYMLEKWENSAGACVEHALACKLDLHIIYQTKGD